jgi:hypothetical protein
MIEAGVVSKDNLEKLTRVLLNVYQPALDQEREYWLPKWYALKSVCVRLDSEGLEKQRDFLSGILTYLKTDFPIGANLEEIPDRTLQDPLTKCEEHLRARADNRDRSEIDQMLDEQALDVIYTARSYWEGLGCGAYEVVELCLNQPKGVTETALISSLKSLAEQAIA